MVDVHCGKCALTQSRANCLGGSLQLVVRLVQFQGCGFNIVVRWGTTGKNRHLGVDGFFQAGDRSGQLFFAFGVNQICQPVGEFARAGQRPIRAFNKLVHPFFVAGASQQPHAGKRRMGTQLFDPRKHVDPRLRAHGHVHRLADLPAGLIGNPFQHRQRGQDNHPQENQFCFQGAEHNSVPYPLFSRSKF